jgi:hypothetical protein
MCRQLFGWGLRVIRTVLFKAACTAATLGTAQLTATCTHPTCSLVCLLCMWC